MDLYNGEINEFVDWSTGLNTFTEQSATGGLLVSGGSIRRLLQNKLKNPFYLKEDPQNNKYRMFSSEEAYRLWAENPTDNQDLELFNFVRPSDYKLDLTATESNGFQSKYIRNGDSNNTGARISYSWSIYNDEGESSDSLSATYTISNSSTGSSTTFTRWYNKSDANPNFSIYNYLQPGENIVTIEARGTTTGARNTKTYTIVLLDVSINSSFKFYGQFPADTPLQIPYVFERNDTSGSAKIYFRIDDGGEGKEFVRDVVQDGPTRLIGTQAASANLSEGQHILQIWAEAKYNDGNTTIFSNLLYFTFTIASSVIGSTAKFINIGAKYTTGNFPLSETMLSAQQYVPFAMQWGYYTDALQSNTQIPVTWKLLDGMDDQNPELLSIITASKDAGSASTINFIPSIYTQQEHETFLCAYFGETLLKAFPIYITKNDKIKVSETSYYQLKMSAYGKTNESSQKTIWKDASDTISTTFTNIKWNTNSGWYENSFRTSGADEYATINFDPFDTFDFTNGKTIEVEFESEKITNNSDKIIVIGDPLAARIEITPDRATLYNNANNEVVHTNYKANERIKLAFIINSIPEDQLMRTVESGLAYIVNNGVLERAAVASQQSFITTGPIKIGGSTSGVRVYNLRVYNYAITYTDAYNNFLYDSTNKSEIADSNNILNNAGDIDFDLCKNRIDTILISGDLSNILRAASDKDTSSTDVTIQRFCPSDSSKNFKINGVQIRKHGQSTLNYPITSMKFWLNKSKSGTTPLYEITSQEDLLLNKNRYVMKSATDSGKPSVPANKFVLQANYADSSGVHNGGLLRLILNSWFNAVIDGEYKLRTAPQLFSTSQVVHHNNSNLGETGWIEGYSNAGKGNILWNNITNQEFPYDIRIAPDSFPCAVFYYDTEGTRTRTFLGQYVFMEDKKSDFNYGERSIYGVAQDPFCLTNTHKDDDTDENLVWDNKNVVRVEVLGSNSPFTSYMTHNNFTDIVEVTDPQTNVTTRMYNWEQVFELVFPDEDDLKAKDDKKGIDKFDANSAYVRKVQPFINFHEWVVSTYQNQAKFEAEAAQHLDLYKMAAYYVFALRFGLVDSLERNAQIKTYDGVHWHYEPWDMDIALGNKNDGGIAYDPPIDRNTKLPGSVTTYAFSGRSANNDGTIATSNWLWDALEAWGYWANVLVPAVADALFSAGSGYSRLTYDNITSMFDENYANKWCEIMYNRSGFFKYVESGNGDATWLSWLQGSRMTHRHWWLSNSMDYYDAKWFCGDYKNHYIYVRANVTEGSTDTIRIKPNKATYMSLTKDNILQTTQSVTQSSPFEFVMSAGSNTKNPLVIYGANFMEEINLSEIALGLDGILLDGVYSLVLGSPLKVLNVGTALTANANGYETTVGVSNCQLQGSADVFKSLTTLNIRGQLNQTDLASMVYNYDMAELTDVYAMGSGITAFSSSQSGNTFDTVEIPDSIYTLYMNNSSWNHLDFWNCNIGLNNVAQLTKITGVPSAVHEVSLLGSTGSTKESLIFVRNWLAAIENDSLSLGSYTLTMDKVNWAPSAEKGITDEDLLTYDELSKLAQLNRASDIRGYIVLKNTGVDLTSQQLNNIKSWFGDTVFTKNSSGLVVDHRKNYIQINVGGNVRVDPQTGDVYLTEGNNASLNATQFSLAEDDDQTRYEWFVGPVDGANTYKRWNGLYVIDAANSVDGIAYITSTQSDVGGDYDVKVECAVGGVTYSTTIHIIGTTYPTTMFINIQNLGLQTPRVLPGYAEMYASNMSMRAFVDTNDTYTGNMNMVSYTLTRLADNVAATYTDGGSTTGVDQFTDQYITLSAGNPNGLRIDADTAMPSDGSIKLYRLNAVVLFTSGVQRQASTVIAVGDDVSPIVSSSQQAMYSATNSAWTLQYGEPIGRNSIYKLDLMSITQVIDFTSVSSALSNLVTVNGSYLFKYLPNCQGIILDGCTSITNTNNSILDEDKTQIDFGVMTKLKKLYILNCTGLTGAIDLTMCPDLEEVDASGTTVNVLVPAGAKLTKYELGTPTSISLVNPTTITPTGVVVDNHNSITSLDLVNIPNTKSFTMFAKIMGVS